MREFRTAIALFFFIAGCVCAARADDFGPPRDIGSVRADAHMLLAHRARIAKVDPKNIVISDVVAVGDQAVASWNFGTQHGLMGLVRQNNRWWDVLDADGSPAWSVRAAYPLQAYTSPIQSPRNVGGDALKARGFNRDLVAAAIAHNADVARAQTSTTQDKTNRNVPATDPVHMPLNADGGAAWIARQDTGGYEITMRYAKNDAVPGSTFARIYARAPTPAEFLPYPTPFRYVSDAVMFFDIIIDSAKPVSFEHGTAVDVWFPFNIDESLKYRMSIGGGREPIGPVVGSVFDNVVHFELPGFTALPGKELMGEVDGDVH
jgi:hypothetical protein